MGTPQIPKSGASSSDVVKFLTQENMTFQMSWANLYNLQIGIIKNTHAANPPKRNSHG